MSDTINIIDDLKESEIAYTNKNYLNAAIAAYWVIQYCKNGEPYGLTANNIDQILYKAQKIYYKAYKHIKKILLSKSSCILGHTCTKALWLYKNKFDQKLIFSNTQRKFDYGHNIGILAKSYFEGGIDASDLYTTRIIDMSKFELPFILKQHLWLKNTEHLKNKNTIYEAAFVYDDVFAAVDILIHKDNTFVAYEVKAAPEITDTFLWDCALQYYVISKHCVLSDFNLMYLNNEYVKELGIPLEKLGNDNCDFSKLFKITSVKSQILEKQNKIIDLIKKCKDTLKKNEPLVNMGYQCDNPYECIFKHYCSKNNLK